MPHMASKIVLGGGAHLDELKSMNMQMKQDKLILYFPTWRDKCVNSDKSIEDVISVIRSNPSFVDWLEKMIIDFLFQCILIINLI